MTLRARNRVFFGFFIASLVVLAGVTFYFVFSLLRGLVTPPVNPFRTINLFPGTLLFSYHFSCSIISIFFFALYVPATAIILYRSFEKTQSIEVNYFLLFLIGCLCEVPRIFIPLDNLWQTTSTTVLFIGRTVIAGRMLCPLSLFFAAVFSEPEQRENVSRNVIMIILISVITAMLIPLDTYHTTTTMAVLWGTKTLFTVIRILIALASFAVMLTNSITKYNSELKDCTIGYAVMITGYAFMCTSDCWFLLVLGGTAFLTGTFYYLRSVHSLYLWR